MKIPPHIGFCGVDCAVCPDYLQGKCPDCRQSDGAPCPPIACCTEKSIACCGECPSFPCEKMADFYAESDSHQAAYARMLAISRSCPRDTDEPT